MEKRLLTLAQNTAILSLGNFFSKALAFLIIPFLTRWMTIENYGIYDLLITYSPLVITLLTGDIGEALFRNLLEEKSLSKKILFIRNVGCFYLLFVLFICICFSGMALFFYRYTDIMLFFIVIVCESIFSLSLFIVRGIKKLTDYSISNFIFMITMSVCAFLFVGLYELQLKGIFLSYILGYLIAILFLFKKNKIVFNIFLPKYDKKIIYEFLIYSLPLLPNAISWWIVGVSDRSIITYFCGSSQNAIYSVSCKIPSIAQVLLNMFHYSWIQNAAETYNDKDRDIYFGKVFTRLFGTATSLICLVISSNFIFFEYIFPSSFSQGYYLTPFLCLGVIFSIVSLFFGGIYIVQKNTKKNGVTTSIAAFINVVVNLAFIKYIGLYAAVLSTLVSYICLFLIRFIDIRKEIKFSFDRKIYFYLFLIVSEMILCILNIKAINYLLLIFSILLFFKVNFRVVRALFCSYAVRRRA